jgi:hypothetical protein
MNNRKNMYIMAFVLSFIFGCREYRYYQYSSVSENLFDGRITVKVMGTYGENYEIDGKKMAEWSFPYRLHFDIEVPLDYQVEKVAITEIKLRGLESGLVSLLKNSSTDKIRLDKDSGMNHAFIAIGDVDRNSLCYEDFVLRFKVELLSGEKSVEKEVDVVIRTDFKKGARSDWFDEKMSP